MSVSQEMIAETACCECTSAYRRVSRRKGHRDASGLLSWYSAQPRVSGLSYVLTANGYVILRDGLSGRGGGLTGNY